ncbi:MAG: redox-sensing transcriptional repressor Rex [Spirochaetales bacterium]|nr:redox-sensing transcriptional repressor Rex [Spirochaetales bacterium]
MSDISKRSIDRLSLYLHYLRDKKEQGIKDISSVTIAGDMNINAVTVKKDLARIAGQSGKPRIGFDIETLIHDIQTALGYNKLDNVVLVGVGQLGHVLLSYNGFAGYGLNIVAGFDTDQSKVGTVVCGKPIFHIDRLADVVSKYDVRMGIITVPKEHAQAAADCMIAAGIQGLWNFAPTHINIPENVMIKNEDLASSLAILSNELRKK